MNEELFGIDLFRRAVEPGDVVIYASRKGDEIKVAVLIKTFQNKIGETKLELRFVNKFEHGNEYQITPSIVTLESFSKRAVLVDPMYWIDTTVMKNAFKLGEKVREKEPI